MRTNRRWNGAGNCAESYPAVLPGLIGGPMYYDVEIREELVETRTVRVLKSEARNAQDAARIAYESWIVNGHCDEGPTIQVDERTYLIDGKSYDLQE